MGPVQRRLDADAPAVGGTGGVDFQSVRHAPSPAAAMLSPMGAVSRRAPPTRRMCGFDLGWLSRVTSALGDPSLRRPEPALPEAPRGRPAQSRAPQTLDELWDRRRCLLDASRSPARRFGEALGQLHEARQFGAIDRPTFRSRVYALQEALQDAIGNTTIREGEYVYASDDLKLQYKRLSQPRPESTGRMARRPA